MAGGLEGDTRTIAIADLIGWLGVQEKTGVLTIRTDGENFTLMFKQGSLIHAASDNPPRGARLGEVMVGLGLITQHQLDQFLGRYAESSERVGEAMEREELVTKDQLRRALEAQVQRLFLRMFEDSKASFSFAEGGFPEADHRIRMNVTHLVLESARQRDEANVSAHDRLRELP
jgi:hypothetical protein